MVSRLGREDGKHELERRNRLNMRRNSIDFHRSSLSRGMNKRDYDPHRRYRFYLRLARIWAANPLEIE